MSVNVKSLKCILFKLDFIPCCPLLTCVLHVCCPLEDCLVGVCIHHGEGDRDVHVDVVQWEGADVEDGAISCSLLSKIALGLDFATVVE